MAVCAKGRGVANFTLDGISYRLESDSDVEVSATTQAREEMEYGEFTITVKSPYITGTFRVPGTQPLKPLQELCGVAITLELYDGRVFYMRSAANVSDEAFDAKKSTLPMRFIGDFMEEVTGT